MGFLDSIQRMMSGKSKNAEANVPLEGNADFWIEAGNEIWQEFSGQRNTSEILEQKAKKLALLILSQSDRDKEKLFSSLSKEGVQLQDQTHKITETVFYEFVLFYSHVVDRYAHVDLEAEQKILFMDHFFLNLQAVIIEGSEEEYVRVFRDNFPDLYNDTQLEYSRYNFPAPDQAYGDTLSWHFGERIADVLTGGKDFRVIHTAMLYAEYAPLVFGLTQMFDG